MYLLLKHVEYRLFAVKLCDSLDEFAAIPGKSIKANAKTLPPPTPTHNIYVLSPTCPQQPAGKIVHRSVSVCNMIFFFFPVVTLLNAIKKKQTTNKNVSLFLLCLIQCVSGAI